jgi:hypothetical protein
MNADKETVEIWAGDCSTHELVVNVSEIISDKKNGIRKRKLLMRCWRWRATAD